MPQEIEIQVPDSFSLEVVDPIRALGPDDRWRRSDLNRAWEDSASLHGRWLGYIVRLTADRISGLSLPPMFPWSPSLPVHQAC